MMQYISPFKRVLQIAFVAALLIPTVFGGNLPPASANGSEAFFPGVYLPFILSNNSEASAQESSDPEWLDRLNDYRSAANLPKLSEQTEWSDGGYLHSRYMVKNDVMEHSEDTNNAWYTEEGNQAAGSSNLMVSANANMADEEAINLWMEAPFHALGILEPCLAEVGFGSYREFDGGIQMGASLDVMRGKTGIVTDDMFPIKWPGDNSVISLLSFSDAENPDPLTSCPGYAQPVGLPIILQLGSGNLSAPVEQHQLLGGSTALESCVFSEYTYKNPDPAKQELGRYLLDRNDAIFLIPREPLRPGVEYTVSIKANGVRYNWSFTTSAQPKTKTAPIKGKPRSLEWDVLRSPPRSPQND